MEEIASRAGTVLGPLTVCLLLAGTDQASGHQVVAQHWAFQPVAKPSVPAVRESAWPGTAVDSFILARLEQCGLAASSPADRRTLIRRAYYDLAGLPPNAGEVDRFVNATEPQAYAELVDRLLESFHFGERWGRYWLDVARFADTKGYIFTEERRFPYSYTYRDWVIRALNEDLPYDQFLIQQIAADQLDTSSDPRQLAALGFLTLGRRFLGNMHDIIDDRIDVVARGTMGLTVGCARCHDHKYDPIPMADYYSLYGVFASSMEKQIAIEPATPEFEKELQARELELESFQDATLARTLHKLRTQVADYLLAARSLKDHPDTQEFMFVENPGDLNRFALGRWRTFLELASKKPDPVWSPWFAFVEIPDAEFAGRAAQVARSFSSGAAIPGAAGGESPKVRHEGGASSAGSEPINPNVARLFDGAAPQSIKDVAQRYGRLFAEIEEEWQQKVKIAASAGAPAPSNLDDASREELRRVLYSADSPTAVPRRRVDDLFEKPDADKLRALRKKVQEWRTSGQAPPNAMALVDSESPVQPVVFLRGNPGNRGPAVPRQFLQVVAGPDRKPFQHGSGRLELARAIACPQNPLTARVLVNRVWLHLFGAGLVRTPSDFGVRSEPPSHPELLDYLAAQFVEDGWSVKKLIRLIMLSRVYQQDSGVRGIGAETAASEKAAVAMEIDPENRLLWRQNRRRLDFEAMRDSLLAAAGDIDLKPGGAALDLAKQPFSRRRTVYGFIDRQNLPGMFRTFDFAGPDTHCPQRFNTTVPQQALFLMNSPFVAEQARRLAALPNVLAESDPGLRIQKLYQHALARSATVEEVSLGRSFVEADGSTAGSPSPSNQTMNPWEQLAQVLLLSNEFMFID